LPTRAELVENFATPRIDLTAGLTVALVALPLALAFGIASGLGAASGIITAIIAGAIAAVLGGSRYQVSGPTGAMTVVLLPIVNQFGKDAVLAVGLMAGVLLCAAGALGLGQHVHRIPTAVIEGFTAGIAVVIALQQVPTALGVHVGATEHVWQTAWLAVSQTSGYNWTSIAIAVAATAIVLIGERLFPKVPFALVAVAAALAAGALFNLPTARIGDLPNLLAAPSTGFLNHSNLAALIPSALAVATLAALESLLSAKVADRLAGTATRHDSDRELLGQGFANLIVPFFGGVPATAALARTAVNVRNGAKSRLAALSHAIFLAAIVLALPALVAQVPLAALAGVLFATTSHMIKPSELMTLAKESRLDALLLVATFAMTIAFDLITAVLVGLALFLLLRKTKLAAVDRRYPPVDKKETLGD
jgi:SulP family sulfate permease